MISKVFISYAWSSKKYISDILGIAERLMADGVGVIIDKWDLEPGYDKYKFMEQMVKDQSIDHVLLMLNKDYQDKADNREGGVGTETQIISAELYEQTDQTKFIPIITERDAKGDEYTLIYLKNRIYVDLSQNDKFESEYDTLLRLIFKRPQYKKPKIGTPPSYLFNDKENESSLNIAERKVLIAIENNSQFINATIQEYVSCLHNNLDSCRLVCKDDDHIAFGKLAFDKFKEMTVYRDSI